MYKLNRVGAANEMQVIGVDEADYCQYEKDTAFVIAKNILSDSDLKKFITKANFNDELKVNYADFQDQGGVFELWLNNVIIGCCSLVVEKQSENGGFWYVTISLNAVIIAPECRGQGVGKVFAKNIGVHVRNELFTLFTKIKFDADIKGVAFTFFADFDSQEGEGFFGVMKDYALDGYALGVLRKLLGCQCTCEIEAGY